MRFVLQGVASEDTVQLFDTGGNPVPGILLAAIEVWIRKEGQAGFVQKTVLAGEWTDRGNGNYALDFSAGDFDTLGLFQYQVLSTASAFVPYQDALDVIDEIPVFPPDPPVINEQTDSPPGVSPDPVYRGDTLTISGENLGQALSVTVNGVLCPITSNTDSEIQVTVLDPDVPLGVDVPVVVKTAGGEDSATVTVVLSPGDIPGAGMCNIYFFVHSAELKGQPKEGVGAWANILDQPNIEDGVGWGDEDILSSSNTDGRIDFWLPRNKRCEVGCPYLNYRRVFMVPDVAEANLFTEVPNP